MTQILAFGLSLITTGIAGGLLQTGLRHPGSKTRVLVGLVLLVGTCVGLRYLAGSEEWGGLTVFFAAIPSIVLAVAMGLWLLISLKGWRKLAAITMGAVFPILLFVGISTASTYAPESLPVEQAALNLTSQLLQTIQTSQTDSRPTNTPAPLWIADDCWKYLRESLALNTNQYTMTVLSAVDTQDPRFTDQVRYAPHDIRSAEIAVRFPDGRQATVFYWINGLSGCRRFGQ